MNSSRKGWDEAFQKIGKDGIDPADDPIFRDFDQLPILSSEWGGIDDPDEDKWTEELLDAKDVIMRNLKKVRESIKEGAESIDDLKKEGQK